jgi:hypothetical protein
MPEMPPKNQSDKYNEEVQHLGLLLRAAAVAGYDFLDPWAAKLQKRLEKGLRAKGLDGGSRMSRYLRGGDAHRTAQWICEPLRGGARDLYNFMVNMTTFLRRFQTGYVDPIRAAENAHDDDVVVVR